MRVFFLWASLILVLGFVFPAYCATLKVPEEYVSIQSAIDNANHGDIVSVANGTYTGTGNADIDPKGKAITITSRNGPELCVIDCQGHPMSTHRGFDLRNGEGPDTVIQGFTITNGMLNGLAIDDEGAGIRCEGASPIIRDCIITGNSAWVGGGIWVAGENESRMLIINTVISDNTCGFEGGGVALYSKNVAVINCTFENNQSDRRGGGMLAACDVFELRDSTFRSNSSAEGGGCHIWGNRSSVMNCSFIDNTATTDAGGGVYYIAPESSTLNCSHFSGNTAFLGGGGIGLTGGDLVVSCCLLSGNHSDGHGSAILLEKGDTDFCNCTFVDHSTPDYSAIYSFNRNNSNFINCICWNPDTSQEVYTMNGNVFMDHTDIRGGYTGIGNIDSDPLFVSGPQGNYYLSSQETGQSTSSPCINGGREDATETCFETFGPEYCINQFTTRTDEVPDTLIADMGYHHSLPAPDHGLNLYLEDTQLEKGDFFKLTYDLHNAEMNALTADVWILLDVFGACWCYPSWVNLEENVDYTTKEVEFYSTYNETVLYFQWPETGGSTEGLLFWGTALKSGTADIIGGIKSIEWSYL